MKWKQVPLGPLQTNGYILHKDNGSALVVDPGGDEEILIEHLQKDNLSVKGILLTHAHFDHIGGVDGLREAYNAPVYIHEAESEWLPNPNLNGSILFLGGKTVETREADFLISEEGMLTIDDWEVQVFFTPGHSPGSVSYYFKEEGVIFSGDVLFHGSIGRTDLPGGDYNTLMDSIRRKLLTLPDETIVANGHGPTTTIGKEKEMNPFINS